MTVPPDRPRIVESRSIGTGTTIGVFTHVHPQARVGEDCVIGENATIGNRVAIGNRVVVGDGARLVGFLDVGDDVIIGPNATFAEGGTSDMTVVEPQARVGAGAIVIAGHTIARGARVQPGTVVTNNVPPNTIVSGNPARIQGYTSRDAESADGRPATLRADGAVISARVKGVEIVDLTEISDLHGKLTVGEVGHGLPFQPKRFFAVYDVPSREVRGEHAHRSLHQLLVCLRGVCTISVDDGTNCEQYQLDSPFLSLYLAPMVWASQSGFSPDATLLVLASEQYDPEDYIRDYDEFVAAVADRRP